jgi:DNA polymerase III subunit beta
MKIEVAQTNLVIALNNVSRIISTKPQLPILNCLLLKVNEDGISLFSTDLNIGIKTKVSGEVVKTGQIAIPAKIFSETIKSLGKDDLTLTLEDQTLFIKSPKTKTSIQCQPSDEFPDFPTLPTLSKTISLQKLKIIEKYVSFSTSLDQARLILTTLLFRQNEEDLQVIGTDGFRLSLLKLAGENISDQKEFLITNKALLEIMKLSSQQDAENIHFEVSNELKQVFFKIGEVDFFVRLVEGSYPPFEKIVPAGFEIEGSFDGEEFENVIKQAVVFAKEVSNIITFEFDEKKLRVSASASAKGSYEGELDINLTKGTGGKISFNVKYLLDFVKNVKPERIWLGMNDELKPAMLKEEGNDFFEYVVMPFRLNS